MSNGRIVLIADQNTQLHYLNYMHGTVSESINEANSPFAYYKKVYNVILCCNRHRTGYEQSLIKDLRVAVSPATPHHYVFGPVSTRRRLLAVLVQPNQNINNRVSGWIKDKVGISSGCRC